MLVQAKYTLLGVANYVSMATSQASPRKHAYVNYLNILKSIDDRRMKTMLREIRGFNLGCNVLKMNLL